MTGRLCPCIDSIFEDTPTREALGRLHGMGFALFEFWDWRRQDLDDMERAKDTLGLRPVIFSGNTFDEPLVTRSDHPRTLRHLDRSLEVARRLGVRLLVAHVGYRSDSATLSDQWEASVEGLRAAGDSAGAKGVTLAVEPLNSKVDHPGYFLDGLVQAERLIDEVGHPSVRLLLDVYHMAVMHDDILDRVGPAIGKTVHVHVADVPGRREPGTGAILWPEMMRRISQAGYREAIGLEFWPSASPEEALGQSSRVLAGA